ncbi:TIGR03943 family putative permease subunit [Anaerosacchariphilus polymeriproducens]|uniref:GTPase n=1 Tax=Anaerosacchariphilus polymeriproducens TaxID=1812858 RepID=A0A371AZ58_9FIRM|nr:GTP-binding protein [Anaerosacchariphilus polymeriproducens]RDU24836.1 GTPase [Anaerosacchariphilus polymeriproducens]
MEIPIYLFTGFLESGKTTVIKETLKDPEFVKGIRTLLIICEEGEVEYDNEYLRENNIDTYWIEEPEQFNENLLFGLELKYEPDQVLIEYNGTWDLEPILDAAMPKGWVIGEIISLIDATTFDIYLSNMRSMILEQLFDSDLIIINRCNETTPKSKFRRSIKAINRKAQIVYELESGEIDNSMEDILPFETEKDSLVIDDDDYGIWYLDALDYPQKYIGKKITFRAILYKKKELDERSFIPGRFVMACCEDDVTFFGFLCKSEQKVDFRHRDWVRVTAEFRYEYVKEYKDKGPVLYLQNIELADKPIEKLVYLN